MLAHLRLHWTVNRKLFAGLTPLLALWSYGGLRALRDPAIPPEHKAVLFAGLALWFGFLPMLVVAFQGLQHPVEAFLLALPVRRNHVVSAAYLAPPLAGLGGLVLPFLVAWAVGLGPRIPDGTFATALVLWHLLVLGLVLYLPLRFRLGGPTGVTVFVGALIAAIVAVYLLGGMKGFDALVRAGAYALDHPLHAGLPAWLGLVALGLASHAYARRAYAARTF